MVDLIVFDCYASIEPHDLVNGLQNCAVPIGNIPMTNIHEEYNGWSSSNSTFTVVSKVFRIIYTSGWNDVSHQTC